jgi:hypothetical protein
VTRTLSGSLYFVAFLLLGLTLLDYFGTVWPFQPGQANWRYGAVGLVSGFVLTPLLGLSLGVAVAIHRQSGTMLRLFGGISLILGVLLVLGTLVFALDAVQVRQSVAAEARKLTEMSAAKAILKMLAAGIASIWLGLGAIRSPQPRKATGREAPPLINQ